MGNKQTARKAAAAPAPARPTGSTSPEAVDPTVAKLARQTHFTVADVRSLHGEFAALAAKSPDPTRIARDDFRAVLEAHSVPWHSDKFCRRLFDYFDQDRAGTVKFSEFVHGLSVLSLGTPRDKLELAFQIFDVDGQGKIARWEMVHVLESIFVGADVFQSDASPGDGDPAAKAARSEKIKAVVDEVFANCDKDQSGHLTYMEFLQAGLKYPELTNFMSQAGDAGRILEGAAEPAVDAGGSRDGAGESKDGNSSAGGRTGGGGSGSKVRAAGPRSADATGESRFSKEQVLALKAKFDALDQASSEAPGAITKEQFKTVLDDFSVDWRSDAYFNRLFDAVDTGGSQTIDYNECLQGMSALLRGTPRDRLELSFEIYDVDATGKISMAEMVSVLKAQSGGGDGDGDGGVQAFVEKVFRDADRDKSGSLSMREYINAAMKYPQLVR